MKPRDLRLLVMHVSTRCDQACAHCSVWRSNRSNPAGLGREQRLALINEARALGARSILFTGGEPLLCDHIEILARAAHQLGLSVQMATNGLGISRAASWLGDVVDEICVSVEGPEAIHDGVRGPGMFSRLRASVAEVRARPKRPRLVGRSVISRRNAAVLEETVAAARLLGLDAVSFLPVDVTSEAFGGDPSSRRTLLPKEPDIAALRGAISRLGARGELGAFVTEDAEKLMRMADGFRENHRDRKAPACNAPEWSSVVEADGALRPCFFQAGVSRVGEGRSLAAARESREYAAALRQFGAGDPTCESCVCPKYAATGVTSVKGRVGAALGRALPGLFPGARISA